MSESLDEFLASYNFSFRLECFRFLGNLLLAQNRPILMIETGSMRPNPDPSGDGQSTLVWDWIANKTSGMCYSVDVNPLHTQYTHNRVSDRTQAVTMDSLKFLSCMAPERTIDMVYLDSMDWEGSDLRKMESSLHHAGELAAAWPFLGPGGIVAVDDCAGRYLGKQALVECFFNLLKVGPIMEGPIFAWQKPCPVI